jgi:hypothetical protein
VRLKSLITLAGVAVLAIMAVAGPAQAAPFHNGDYPRYAYEGRYPEQTPCRYSLNQSRTASWGGHSIRLRYFYSGGCGSFARIDNAPRNCTAIIDRSADGGRTWSSVWESVDPGINFAYTQVGNNLSGRVSRAALACDRHLVARTNWY